MTTTQGRKRMDVVRVIVCAVQLLVVMTMLCGLQTAAENESFMAPSPACPSKTATFTCTVNDTNHYNGGRLGTTYWQVGNYSPCALPHADPTVMKECGPNNAFVARSQPPRSNYYTSTLTVTAHPSLNGTRVRCYVPDGRGQERTVGRGMLEVIGAPPAPSFLPPNESDFKVLEGSVNVTMRWSESHDYRHTANITSYNITANCTMPSQGSSWVETLTVQDSQKMMSFPVGVVATLTVHADVCDALVGNESKALEFCIEVPEAVPHCSTTAVYNGSSDELTNIVVNWSKAETPCHQNLMAPGLSSHVRSYAVSVNKQTVEQEYICTNVSELCSYAWNVADYEAVNYMVSVAANNVVGQGVTKNCTTTAIGRLNNVLSVDMQVDSYSILNVNCTFLGSFQGVGYCEIKLSSTDSTFTYWQQSQERASAGGSVLINNIALNTSTVYFYNVSAVLEDESAPVVVVQGVITTLSTTTPSTSEVHRNSTVSPQSSQSSWGIIVGVMLPVAVVLIAVIAILLCLCKFHKRIKGCRCGANEIDGEENGRVEADGSESSDGKHDRSRAKKGGPYKVYYYRSLSAPQHAKSHIDPSSSLPLNIMSESDIDPFRSLPPNIMRQLSRENRYPTNEDQCWLLKDDAGEEQ